MMKISKKKNGCKSYILLPLVLVFFLINQISAFAQIKETKTIEKTYALTSNDIFSLKHSNGPILVTEATDGKVSLQVIATVSGDQMEDVKLVLDHVEAEEDIFGSKTAITTSLNYSSWNSMNNNTKIRFKDGSKAKNIRNVEIKCLLSVPPLQLLQLENKYDDIRLEEMNNNIFVKSYSGKLTALNINGDLELELKYAKGNIKNVKNANITLYDSEFKMENGETVSLTSKYSEFEMGDFNNLNMKTYDDNYKLGSVKDKLILEDKYSEIGLISFSTGDLKIYDATLSFENANNLKLESKYSEYEIKSLGHLTLIPSHDDEFDIEDLGGFDCESKYTEFDIETFHGNFKLNSHDDDIKIRNITSLDGLSLTCKYTDIDFPIGSNIACSIEANLTYGDIKFDENIFETQRYIEKSSVTELKAKTKNATDTSPILVINAYDSDIDLD